MGGDVYWQPLPPASSTATTSDGYRVRVAGTASRASRDTELAFTVTRAGKPVQVERYLGAGGHLVALRQRDMAYLHVHPETERPAAGPVKFITAFPSASSYRLFLQFKAGGQVRTAAFTRSVNR